MINVHGTYVPVGTGGCFFLWGERTRPSGEKWRALQPYPGAAAGSDLYPILGGMPYVNALALNAWMPSARGLIPSRLPGLTLAVGNAVQWLLDLDAAFEQSGLRPGHSLRAWSAAAKLLVELLGRGRILPYLGVEAGVLTAQWRLSTPEPGDQIRLDQVEAAIPDLCRAIVPPDRKHTRYRPPSAGALLGEFLAMATAALARLYMGTDQVPDAHAGLASAAQHWLLGLSGQGPRDLPTSLADAAALHAAVDAWAAPVSGLRAHHALRSGIRLRLPTESESGQWEIELVLQTSGDPPVAIAASEAWARLDGELVVDTQRYQGVGRRLLADLRVMARLFGAMAPLALEPEPSRLPVAEAEVLSLLQEGAQLLQEAGFPVLLPAGLIRPAALRATLRLGSSEEGESRFGLSQLVAVNWDLALGDLTLSYADLESLARQKRPLVQHRGHWVAVDQQVLARALKQLQPYRERIALGDALRLAAAGPGESGAEADADASAPGASVQVSVGEASGWVARLLERLREPARLEPVPAPSGFRGALRPYQERGFAWLSFLRRYGMGACLADDMGLGKTVQLIALLLREREQDQAQAREQGGSRKPVLLVCPVSVVGNWRRELERFAPDLGVLIHHGSGRAGEGELNATAAGHDLVITTYSLLSRDEADLAAVAWSGIVADEAQNIKNPATKHAQALRRLPAEYRIALTGTPVENHLGDLWSLFAFLNPGLLGGVEEFRRTFAIPIERYRDADAAARLRRLVQPFLLRRVKSDPTIIADLPEKAEQTVYTNLTVEQAALYEAVVQETLERAAQSEGIQRHGAVLAGLTRLKQVCNHPAHATGDSGPLAGRSGKLDRLVAMLEEVLAEGDRALIFTQFPHFGGRVREYLARRLGCEVLFLDGTTPREEREERIARFQAGEAPLFVLSLKAGGVGLNLTAANHVFHFDRWWNPAVEDQATDRAFRIGQTRRVLVHKLVTAGTLEERIDRVLTEKRSLSQEVIGSGEGWLGSLSTEELRSLITLQQEA